MKTSEQVLREIVSFVALPEFPSCSVPISVVAKVMQRDPVYIREGIAQGWLPIGTCNKVGARRNFYISPKLLWEYTGFLYKPEAVSYTHLDVYKRQTEYHLSRIRSI